ncbi:MAG TPA: CYTH domain-containing protein [Candidatus Marinimicrobia bacterium]|nr:CYTH domain-containing protein [Candidatus Neomarinimicrobiota bacterium]
MAVEIERKYLVKRNAYKSLAKPVPIRQGYISADIYRIVRVRIAGERAWIGIKSLVTNLERLEFEYEIPPGDAEMILSKVCPHPIIEKYRYALDVGGDHWIVDEFLGENRGLVVAEIELESPEQNIHLPDWVGEEVSNDPRYLNANLAVHPYSRWRDRQDS